MRTALTICLALALGGCSMDLASEGGPAAIEPLAPYYAVWVATNVTVEEKAAQPDGTHKREEGHALQRGIFWAASEGPGEYTLCSLDLPVQGSKKTVSPDAIPFLPRMPMTWTLTDGGYAVDPWVMVLGARLANPWMDPLPAVDEHGEFDDAEKRLVDNLGDDDPGFSVSVNWHHIVSATFHLGLRMFMGGGLLRPVAGTTALSGDLGTMSQEVHVWGESWHVWGSVFDHDLALQQMIGEWNVVSQRHTMVAVPLRPDQIARLAAARAATTPDRPRTGCEVVLEMLDPPALVAPVVTELLFPLPEDPFDRAMDLPTPENI